MIVFEGVTLLLPPSCRSLFLLLLLLPFLVADYIYKTSSAFSDLLPRHLFFFPSISTSARYFPPSCGAGLSTSCSSGFWSPEP